VARVLAFIPDLLFGSHVVGALQNAGHEVQLASSPEDASKADVLIVDLTADPAPRIDQVSALGAERPPTLAFFSHVEPDVREQAQAAGFELVVPRSRMNREGPALVAGLLADQ
jgi:DNA-binding NarL/FixJ family response regulator